MAPTEKILKKRLACKSENDVNQKVDANVHLVDKMRKAEQLMNQIETKRNHTSGFRFLIADLKRVLNKTKITM